MTESRGAEGEMMIESTKDRLEEARFFLSKLRQHKVAQAQPRRPPPEHFRYYLGAFVTAARSVTWVLQREEGEKYDAWKGSWEGQRTEAENALLKLTTQMRNTSVKEGHIETTVRSERTPISVSPDSYQVHALRAWSLSLSQGGGPWTISDVHFVELNGSEQEIVVVCEQYVNHLTRLVQDFIDKHPE
jgi:hypothetical protein